MKPFCFLFVAILFTFFTTFKITAQQDVLEDNYLIVLDDLKPLIDLLIVKGFTIKFEIPPKKGPFGQRIAQFSCTFSIGIALTASIVNKRAFTYGFERLRFPNPVFIGDTIHTKVTIKEKKDDPKRPQYGQVNEACEILNQNDKCVCYSEHILLVERKIT